MEVVVMILHLLNGEIAKVPVTLMLNQTCSDKFIEMVQPKSNDIGVLYKGVEVWAVSCHKGNGEWVK